MVVKKKSEPIKPVSSNKDLLDSMDKLVKRIDRMVGMFEEASKHVDEVESTEARVRTLADKLDELVEQNKAVARGLLLLEKYVRGRTGLTGDTEKSDYGGL